MSLAAGSSLAPVALGSAVDAGTRQATYRAGAGNGWLTEPATVPADHDERLLARSSTTEHPTWLDDIRVRAQTAQLLVQPAVFGSALTGTGVEGVMDAIAHVLPVADGDPTTRR